MQLEAFKLEFNTPLHIGRGNEADMSKSETIIHSDVLKSALFAVGIHLFPEWIEKPETFFNGFKITSCFPYAGDELFLPKPMQKTEFRFKNTSTELQAKKSKKIEYFNIEIFTKLIKDKEIEIDEDFISPDGHFVCKSPDCFTDSETQQRFSFFKSEVQQRVHVPLEWENSDSKPYYIDRIYFEKNCGLYFLLHFLDNAIKEKIITVIKLLGETGIGTDRSVGNGMFHFDESIHIKTIDFQIKSNLKKYLCLGLFLPTETEFNQIDFDKSSWGLIKRGGYMGGSSENEFYSLRKKSVYMFTEASILSSDTLLNGKFIDLKPDWDEKRIHSVWRDGQCLILEI